MSSSLPLKREIIDILGVNVDDISCENAVKKLVVWVNSAKKGRYVVTVNSEFVMLARKSPHFARVLANAHLAVADGKFVARSKLKFGGKYPDRITGANLIEKLCSYRADKAIRVGFLGGFDKVAETVAKCQKKANSKLKVIMAESGNPSIGYDLRLKKEISKAGGIDVLFVAYGMGQQEFWIERNLKKLDVKVFIGVGGAFDVLSGVKKRSPKILQDMGFEWFWRLINEPKRAWRMRVLPVFFVLIGLSRIKRAIFNKN